MQNIKFSITIPAYKATYLSEAIQSVLDQTYSNLELIIVDDHSPENIEGIVKSFTDSRIFYYRNEKNCGAINVVDNWNLCLDKCIGDYVICMGDDDRLMPNCLSEYCKLIALYPGLSVYHGWSQIIDENSNVFAMQSARPIFEGVFSMMWHKWYTMRTQFIGDFLYDVKKLREHGGYYKLPMAWASDDITSYRAAMDLGIANTQVPVFQYRQSRHSLSSSGSVAIKLTAMEGEAKWYQHLFEHFIPNDEYEEIYKIMAVKILPKYLDKQKGRFVASDIKNEGLHRFIYWIWNRNKYSISKKSLIYALLYTFSK